MPSLSKNQESFVQMMLKSDEHSRKGFELLAQHATPELFFDNVVAVGLLDPAKNPGPRRVDDDSVRIPYWPATDYLKACGERSAVIGSLELAGKVMGVVRATTLFVDQDGSARDNYHTYRQFAEVMAAVPTDALTLSDMDLVRQWLDSKYNTSSVARVLDEKVMPRLLVSDSSADIEKATRLLRHCVAIKHPGEGTGPQSNDSDPTTAVDPYWLEQLIEHHAVQFGSRAGADAATTFRDAVGKMFERGGRAEWSYVFRPAVEDHTQNHSWNHAENGLVEGLRDVILSWSEVDPDGARYFVSHLLSSDVEMLRRVGIFALSHNWSTFRSLYGEKMSADLLDLGHLHEMFNLLKNRFEQFTDPEKELTIESLKSLPLGSGDDAADRRKRVQRRWLEAIRDTDYEPARTWLAELNADGNIGVPPHPDFNSYMEVGWGPGPSPFSAKELIALAERGTVVDHINGFKQAEAWNAPNEEALVQALEQAVAAGIGSFVAVLPDFAHAKPAYQHAVLAGFRRAWDSGKAQSTSSQNWDTVWPVLFDYFEVLLKQPGIGSIQEEGTPVGWLASGIADLLQAGTKEDERSLPLPLMSRAWLCLNQLADIVEPSQGPDEADPMSRAINSSKGRTLEAIFSHALRECRAADKANGSHTEAWARVSARFDAELEKTSVGNYEFSTLAGAYLANIGYMSDDWLRRNIGTLFPKDRPANFVAAVSGLPYSAATRYTYKLLQESGVVDAALGKELKGRDTRKALVDRVMLSYLWGDETLDSPRIQYMFDNALVEDLRAAAHLFWTIRGDNVVIAQRQRVAAFFDRCVGWAQQHSGPLGELLAALAELAWVLPDARGRNGEVLAAVAPHVANAHGAYEFLDELIRIADTDPAQVSAVLGLLVQPNSGFYDYEGRLKRLLSRLVDLGQRRAVLAHCERLKDVNGVPEYFAQLRRETAP